MLSVLVFDADIITSVSPNWSPSTSCAIALIPGVLFKLRIFLSNCTIFNISLVFILLKINFEILSLEMLSCFLASALISTLPILPSTIKI